MRDFSWSPLTVIVSCPICKSSILVLPVYSYVGNVLSLISISRHWVADTDGLVETEQVGFGGDGKSG